MLKTLAKYAGALPFRLAPPLLNRYVIRLILLATERGEPRAAMKRLLLLDDDLIMFINQVAMRYDDGVHVKHRLTRYHDYFVERIGEGERVLDIGCGYGAVAYSVASRSDAQVVGIDINRQNIDKANRLYSHPQLTFVHGDALKQLPEGPYDVVLMSNVLEHIEHRVAFLKRVQESSNPKRWLIRVPLYNREWLVPMRKELGMRYFSDTTHFTEYTEGSFRREMSSVGLALNDMIIIWGEIWAELFATERESGQ